MLESVIIIIACNVSTFGWLHAGILSFRPRSLYYESHRLVKKKGIAKLIYFKPKHFHRYTLDEVIFFFASYLSLVLGIILVILTLTETIEGNMGVGISLIFSIFFFLYEVFRIIIGYIMEYCEDKFFMKREGVYCLLDDKLKKSYTERLSRVDPNDVDNIELLDEEYIQYYRNYRKLKVIKENKDGTLVVEIDK